MKIEIFEKEYAVCKLPAGSDVPKWASQVFSCVTVCDNELSIVAERHLVPDEFECETDWTLMRIVGQIDFNQVGVVAKISKAIADENLPIFVISTFNTDYILIKRPNRAAAANALVRAGYEIC